MIVVINDKHTHRQIDIFKDKVLVETYKQKNKNAICEGDIFIGTVEDVYDGLQSAFVNFGDEKNGYIYIKDVLPKVDETKKHLNYKNMKISKYIKPKDNIIVQIKKKASITKGAKLSTHLCLNGKYCVLMPKTNLITISKKITDEKQKNHLKQIAKDKLGDDFGIIIRTKALGNEQNLIDEINSLKEQWQIINQRIDIIEKGTLAQMQKNRRIYKATNLIEQLFLDYDFDEFEAVYVSSEETKQEVQRITKNNVEIIVKPSDELDNIFNLEKQKEALKNKRIWLKSGGFIVIEQTEALTAIDVNSGKFIGKSTLDDTVMKVNKEATLEIAKQLKLRDIGGIIIIDYIDMTTNEQRDEIINLLKDTFKLERTKYQINGFTSLDLLEMTRKQLYQEE